MVINRAITEKLQNIAHQLPVIAVLGPRQSGKTTLSRLAFPNHAYISLEDIDVRSRANQDPRDFIDSLKNDHGIILDEIQHAPSLLSYIQTIVDLEDRSGFFILTGSQNFLVNQAISQTLAGRIGILTLLPLSISELSDNSLLPSNIEEAAFKGGYPRLYAKDIDQTLWYTSYTQTYIERDVRQVASIADVTVFQLFLKLCAGRIGQMLNVSSLANDCGIPLRTANAWLSLLQESYVIFLLQPYYKNFSKRIVKTPKLYFYDTGLASSLLGIESAEQLHSHYLRGGLIECYLISDFYKQFYNQAKKPHIYFWRDNHGHEIDCLIERGSTMYPIEIKSGKTVTDDYFKAITYWNNLTDTNSESSYIIYGGTNDQKRSKGNIISWHTAANIITKKLLP